MPADPRENRSSADGAKAKVGELSAGVRNALREVDAQHQAIAEHVDTVAKATKLAARRNQQAANWRPLRR
jgi:hypothetical protein